MTDWRTSISLQPFVQTRGSLLYTSISLHPVFQTCFDCGSVSAYTHHSPVLCFECVWIVNPCLRTRICLQPCSNTFDYGCLFVYPPARTKMKATPELQKIFQNHEVFLCGFLHLSRHRADLPSGMSIMQQFKLLGSSARFVRDAPLRPSSTQGVELFFPLFSKSFCVNVVSVSFPARCDLP